LTARTYTLDVTEVAQLVPAADVMGRLIEESIGQLLDPAPALQLFPNDYGQDPERYGDAMNVYDDAGLLAELESDGEAALTTAQAADLLELAPTTIRRWVQEGKLEAIVVSSTHGQPRLGITRASVEALLKVEAQMFQTGQVLSELGIGYRTLQDLAKRLGLAPGRKEDRRAVVWTAEQVETIRAQLDKERAFREAAASRREAADALRLNWNSVQPFLDSGVLEVHEEATECLGFVMITRASLEALVAKRSRRRRAQSTGPAEGSVTLEEVMERLGLRRSEALALARQGVKITRDRSGQFYVDGPSLEACLADGSGFESDFG